MREEDLYGRIRVIRDTDASVIGAGLVYHWRAGDGTRLCGSPGTEPVITLKEAKDLLLSVCHRCTRVAEEMAKGW